MFDMCTVSTLAVLGVNVTFMSGSTVVCRTLGMIEIKERHTAINLADMVYNILAEFDVPLVNVFSITTDNAKNATNTSEVLNLVANSGDSGNEITDEDIFDVGFEQESFDFGIDLENEAELQQIIDNAAAHAQLMQEMARTVFCQNKSIVLINQVNCGTHTFQLSINDALNDTNANGTIAKVHEMCLLYELRKLDKRTILPPLDNATRWNSKYIMVNNICLQFLKKYHIYYLYIHYSVVIF